MTVSNELPQTVREASLVQQHLIQFRFPLKMKVNYSPSALCEQIDI